MTKTSRRLSWVVVAISALFEMAIGMYLIGENGGILIIGYILITVGIFTHVAVYLLPTEDEHEVYFPPDQNRHVCIDGRWYIKTDFLAHIRDQKVIKREIEYDG